mmetsp:Transcript_58882/g.170820  ORF Transcript_58882/g.170820 Transcript_58882/m.170820 type:complete len:212 (-) Transcript_58882:1090-1725(-)
MAECEIRRVSLLTVELRELVQVIAEQFRDDNQVLLVIEIVDQSQTPHFINVAAIPIDQLKQLDLVKGLVHIILVVLDNLHADHLARVQVEALHGPGEGSRPQVVQHLISSRNDAVDLDRELLDLFESRAVPFVHDTQVEAVEDHAVALGRVEGVLGRRVVVHRSHAGAPRFPVAARENVGRHPMRRHRTTPRCAEGKHAAAPFGHGRHRRV